MAMMRSAPAMRAPWITFRPTPPQPNTATDEPGSTFAVLNTAPTPVVTAQPTSAARSSGIFGSIFTRLSTEQRGVLGHHAAAGEDVERLARRVARAQRAVGRRGERLALLEAQHRPAGGAEAALAAHVDEGGDDVVAGLARPSRPRRPRPPRRRASWPSTSGGGSAMVPLVADRSEWHTPQAAIFTVTSPRLRRVDRDLLDHDRLVQLAAERRFCLPGHARV